MIRQTGLILLFGFLLLPAASASSFDAYGKVERFTWSEHDSEGTILKENGPLFTVGLVRKKQNANRSFTRSEAAYFGGSVAYDGETWDGTPVASNTEYNGLKLEYSLYNPTSQTTYAFWGLGYSQWNRDLISTQLSQGYREKWNSLYAKIGLYHESDHSRYEFGIKYPLKTENRIHLFSATTTPESQASLFASISQTIAKDVSLSLTYDRMKFDASKPVLSPNLAQYIYQPKSDSESWGLRLAAKW